MDSILHPTIDPAVRDAYGAVNVAFLVLSNLTVTKTPPRLKKIARKAEAELREAAADRWPGEGLSSWEELAGRMGLVQRSDLPAPRELAESIRAGRTIPKINSVVDAANVTAICYETPVGAFDLDTLEPPITLGLAGAGASITPILATSPVTCVEDEIVYADKNRVFSRYSRDADFSKITDDTKHVLCVVDGTPEMPTSRLTEAAELLAGLLTDALEGQVSIDGPHLAKVRDDLKIS